MVVVPYTLAPIPRCGGGSSSETLSHAKERESWALGRFEMVAYAGLTKSSRPLGQALGLL